LDFTIVVRVNLIHDLLQQIVGIFQGCTRSSVCPSMVSEQSFGPLP
jgi:hypothetical protein